MDEMQSEHRKAAAVQYEEFMNAPRLLAYGEQRLADAIVNAAARYNVPVLRQPDEVLQILKSVPQGGEVPPVLYEAMVEVIAYVFQKKK